MRLDNLKKSQHFKYHFFTVFLILAAFLMLTTCGKIGGKNMVGVALPKLIPQGKLSAPKLVEKMAGGLFTEQKSYMTRI